MSALEYVLRTTWFFVVLPQTETGVWRDIKGTRLPLGCLHRGLQFHVSPIQVTVLLGVFSTVFKFSFLGLLCGFGTKHVQHFYLSHVNQLCRVAKSGPSKVSGVLSEHPQQLKHFLCCCRLFFKFIFSLRSSSTIQQLQELSPEPTGLVGSIEHRHLSPRRHVTLIVFGGQLVARKQAAVRVAVRTGF